MPIRTTELATLLAQGVPVVMSHSIRSGKTWAETTDFVNRKYGPLTDQTLATLANLAQQTLDSGVAITAALRAGAEVSHGPNPTIRGFNPDPENAGREYYEVSVPYFSETAAGTMIVTIKSDRPLSPSEVEEQAQQEAADRLSMSPDGFGWTPDELDVLGFGEVTVEGHWKTY